MPCSISLKSRRAAVKTFPKILPAMFESPFSRHCFLPFRGTPHFASLRSSLTFTSLHLLNSPEGSGPVWRCVSNGGAGAEGNVTLPERPIGTPTRHFYCCSCDSEWESIPRSVRIRSRGGSDQSERRPPWDSVLRIWKYLEVAWCHIHRKFSAV
ncbi:hypothetical protein CEXT_701911 [Caerostris extrusa]|uniref:Uncharacterized protein n=1 Tax=Caerostris extrusa TaxID=172846 RepID=A0AAV4VKC7_CAEEX|nr:hypothetical protein CEXT_701911 [Caerostris extrusa]